MTSSNINSVVIEVLKTEDSKRLRDSHTLRRRLVHFLDQQDFKEDTVIQGDQINQVHSCLSSLLDPIGSQYIRQNLCLSFSL